MLPAVINIIVVLLSFAMMEAVAWVSHKYLMHGLLWILHKDHHDKTNRGYFEHNDFFFLIFALPAMVCLAVGIFAAAAVMLYIGIGITLYGFCYFIVHDIIIHQRIKWFRHINNRYLTGIRRAHKMHHKHLGKENGECFGMLCVPLRYFRKEEK